MLAAEATGRFPRLAASYLIEAQSQILDAHRPDRTLPPASLTKIMTALLVLEPGRLDEVVTVGADAVRGRGSRVGLRAGGGSP